MVAMEHHHQQQQQQQQLTTQSSEQAPSDSLANDKIPSPSESKLIGSKSSLLGFNHFTSPTSSSTVLTKAGEPAAALEGSAKCSGGDPSAWWRRTRIHVALLGLAIAVVNCYAQASFSIAIVEMVYPPDYVSKLATNNSEPLRSLSTTTTITNDVTRNTSSKQLMSEPEVAQFKGHSCPIEFKYRDYYDKWRFPEESASSVRNTTINYESNSEESKLRAEQSTSGHVDVSNRFQWDASQQGLLLGAFAFGTAPLQIVGGRLSEIYGSKWVLLVACLGTALTNLTIPHIARFSFLLLLANRVLMGVAQAGMESGLMCLLADWLTPQEASFFISMSLFAMCVGFFLGLLGTTLILALGYGWPLVYYVTGGLNLAVGLVWYFYADSWPRESKHIGQSELQHIVQQQQQQQQQRGKKRQQLEGTFDLISSDHIDNQNISTDCALTGAISKAQTQTQTHHQHQHQHQISISVPVELCSKLEERSEPLEEAANSATAPWRNILTTRSVWAFIICKISVRWCADVLSNMMPTYLANVLHLSIHINGLFMSISTALFVVSSFLAGWLASEIFLADREHEHNHQEESNTLARSRKKTLVRKSFQSVASFGSTICLILMTLYDCDIVFSMSMLLLLSSCLVMGSGGELQIPYDMSSRYPGTLHGMACTLSVSGWLAPPLIGLVLADQPNSRFRWSIVWNSTAAITLLGGLAFLLFADSSPRDFDANQSARRSERRKTKDLEDDSKSDQHEPNKLNGAPQVAGYVNGALNSSSCESSPKCVRDTRPTSSPSDCSIHQFKLNSDLNEATGVQLEMESNKLQQQQQLELERHKMDSVCPAREPSEPPFECLEANFDGRRVEELRASGREVIPTTPLAIKGPPDGRKTIARAVSSGAIIEAHNHHHQLELELELELGQQLERQQRLAHQTNCDAPSATMINGPRNKTGGRVKSFVSSWLAQPAAQQANGHSAQIAKTPPPDLNSARGCSVEAAAAAAAAASQLHLRRPFERAHCNGAAAQHRASLDAAMGARGALKRNFAPPLAPLKAAAFGSVTHL